MPIAPCTCCCCCKVCGWCLPDRLYVRVHDLVFPECVGGGAGCGCNDTDWMDDQTMEVWSRSGKCVEWPDTGHGPEEICASACGSLGMHFDDCRRAYGNSCNVVNEYHLGCDCVVPRGGPPVPIEFVVHGYKVEVYCNRDDESYPTGLHVFLGWYYTGVGLNYCCWHGDPAGLFEPAPGTYTSRFFDSRVASGAAVESGPGTGVFYLNATWELDEEVCDADGFISKTWSFETSSGITGKVTVYV